MSYAAAAKALLAARSVIVTTHINPDGDGLGSGLALVRALKSLGKKVSFACPSVPAAAYAFLPDAKLIKPVVDEAAAKRFAVADVVISCDAGDLKRLGAVGDVAARVRAKGGTLINLDHHITNDNFGDINLVDVSGESSGVVVERLLRRLKVPLDPVLAELLYVTIVFDTGRFMHSNTTAHTFRWTAKLLDQGIDASAINRALTYTRTFQELKIQNLAIDHLRVDEEQPALAGIAMPAPVIDALGKVEEWGDLVEIPRSLRGNQVAYLVRERADKEGRPLCRVSLRSNPPYEVGSIAQDFGGGGHAQAAGCTIDGDLPLVLAALLPRLRAAAAPPAKRAKRSRSVAQRRAL